MALQTTDQVAISLGVTRARVHQLVKQLGLKPQKRWGQLFFTTAEQKKMAKRKTQPGPQANVKREQNE